MKAQKKPVIIDYYEITQDTFFDEKPFVQWVESFDVKFFDWFKTSHDPFEIQVKTLEGTSYDVTDDDMIIRGIANEFYPCKKDIFYKTYDVLK